MRLAGLVRLLGASGGCGTRRPCCPTSPTRSAS